MNKCLFIVLLLTCVLAGEAIVKALVSHDYELCLLDTTSDGEAEKDSKEKSEHDSKVKISFLCATHLLNASFTHGEFNIHIISSQAYIDILTRPPKSA